ncbi:hypothetical protein BD410DRAFT_897701 [Rickenella mellea]|uniref:DUF6593 domain-containing protein n=1 Tax=Rickenella mellea TaxID=50990 RepID=A0A4Y7Q7R7_9AGAM|nr:hypothetical protein BD410DRAFT_897701 [Rickenella mellea]
MTIFELTSSDIQNCSVLLENRQTRYTVETNKPGNHTFIREGGKEGKCLATIGRHGLKADTIQFGENQPVSVGSWLKSGFLGLGRGLPASFSHNGRKYTWKDVDKDTIAVFASDSPQPIATYHKPPPYRLAKEGITLSIHSHVEESLRNLIIISLVDIEYSRQGKAMEQERDYTAAATYASLRG